MYINSIIYSDHRYIFHISLKLILFVFWNWLKKYADIFALTKHIWFRLQFMVCLIKAASFAMSVVCKHWNKQCGLFHSLQWNLIPSHLTQFCQQCTWILNIYAQFPMHSVLKFNVLMCSPCVMCCFYYFDFQF